MGAGYKIHRKNIAKIRKQREEELYVNKRK